MKLTKIITGAAFGTILGSLAAFLYPRRHEVIETVRQRSADLAELAHQAKGYKELLFDNRSRRLFKKIQPRNQYFKGGLVGLIIGAGTAFLIAPKSGKMLRAQLARSYNDITGKSEEILHQFKNNSHFPFSIVRSKAGTRKRTPPKRKPIMKKS